MAFIATRGRIFPEGSPSKNIKAALKLAKEYSEKSIFPGKMHAEALTLRRRASFSLISSEQEGGQRFREAAARASQQWHNAYLLDLAATLTETDSGKNIFPNTGPDALVLIASELRVSAGHLSAHPSREDSWETIWGWNTVVVENMSEGARLNAKAEICLMRARELRESEGTK